MRGYVSASPSPAQPLAKIDSLYKLVTLLEAQN